jgi:hypothetical protein
VKCFNQARGAARILPVGGGGLGQGCNCMFSGEQMVRPPAGQGYSKDSACVVGASRFATRLGL